MNTKLKLITPISVACVLMLQGCATKIDNNFLKSEAKDAIERIDELKSGSPFKYTDDLYIPVVIKQKNAKAVNSDNWLKAIKIDLNLGSQPLQLSEVLRMLSKQGINITSELPLDKFYYSGFKFENVDGETALKAILASVSLDYSVDQKSKIVVIKPLSSKTWYLNIGNRITEYSSNGAGTKGNQGSSSSGGTSGGSGAVQAAGSSSITSKDNFWDSLAKELDQRTQVNILNSSNKSVTNSAGALAAIPAVIPGAPLPNVAAPAVPNGQAAATAPGAVSASGNVVNVPPPNGASSVVNPAALNGIIKPGSAATNTAAPASGDSSLKYDKVSIATYAINAETGAITVQGPSWLLEDLDKYFKKIQEMYNTEIVFEGELIMLTQDKSESTGFNISSFASFAQKRYGLILDTNTSGGNVTVSIPKNNAVISTGGSGSTESNTPNMLSWIPSVSGNISAPMLGFQSIADGLQIFNNYLSTLGSVTTIQKPVITTSSGVPGDFRKTYMRYYNSVSQNVAGGGTGSAAVGTQNTMVSQEFGTVLRVNPRYDAFTGLIKAQIELVQINLAGTQAIPQSITSGNTVQQVVANVPLPSKILYSGEAIFKSGEMVIMGGQAEESGTDTGSGITGAKDVAILKPITSTSQTTQSKNIFYFALKATANKK